MKTTKKNIKKNKNKTKKSTIHQYIKKHKKKIYFLKGGANKEAEAEEELTPEEIEAKKKELIAKIKKELLESCGDPDEDKSGNVAWCRKQMEDRIADPGKNSCNWSTEEGECDPYLPPLYQTYQSVFAPTGYGMYWTGHKIGELIGSFSLFNLTAIYEVMNKAKQQAEEAQKSFTKGVSSVTAFAKGQHGISGAVTGVPLPVGPLPVGPLPGASALSVAAGGGRKTRRKKINNSKRRK